MLTPTVRGCAQAASADGIVALGLLLATDATLARRRGDPARAAPLLALGLAIAVFAKSEGALLAVLLVLANLPAWRHAADRARALRWLALPAATFAAGWLLNRVHGFSYYLLADFGKGNLLARFWRQAPTHAPEVARTFLRELAFPATCTNGLFAALFLLTALAPRTARAAGALWPALALLAAVLAHATLMIGTGTDLAWSLADRDAAPLDAARALGRAAGRRRVSRRRADKMPPGVAGLAPRQAGGPHTTESTPYPLPR
jgi:hypothetical protein